MKRLQHLTAFLVLLLCLGVASPLLAAFTIKDEQELGRKFNVMVRSRLPLVEDPEVKSYINGMLERILAAAPPQPFRFTADVFLSNSVNAFATPGGYLFVNTGLILSMEHENEVAGVLAHEIAHVTQRHIAKRMEREQTISLLSVLGALAGAFLGGEGGAGLMAGSLAAGQAAMLNYSRVDESEADQFGLIYMINAGYNPQGMAEAFKRIRQYQWMAGGGSIPTYLSTHPDVTNRISEVSARIEKLSDAVRTMPHDDERFLKVQTLIRARYTEASSAMRHFEQAPENDCLALMGQGIVAERMNRIPQAAEIFERVLLCNPDEQLFWREAGRFHAGRGNPATGEQYLAKALAMNPHDYLALFFRARLLSTTGKNAESIPVFEQVLRYVPEDSEVHYYYGRALGETGNEFRGYLHMAYSALYIHDIRRLETYRNKAQALAVTDAEVEAMERFDERYAERREFWE